jgi:hypothetical protein
MTWCWRFESDDASPVTVGGLDETQWSSQADAESWIGENWPILLDAGVDQVVLVDDDVVVYGPMSLHPTDPHPS